MLISTLPCLLVERIVSPAFKNSLQIDFTEVREPPGFPLRSIIKLFAPLLINLSTEFFNSIGIVPMPMGDRQESAVVIKNLTK